MLKRSSVQIIIAKASGADVSDICRIDRLQIHSSSRRSFIEKAIRARNCLVAKFNGRNVGFAIVDQTFYGQSFIWLLIVSPRFRRRGVAVALISKIESECPTGKLFTSTNRSNLIMQQLLRKRGFIRSGRIDNLDENDPELVYFKPIRRV